MNKMQLLRSRNQWAWVPILLWRLSGVGFWVGGQAGQAHGKVAVLAELCGRTEVRRTH